MRNVPTCPRRATSAFRSPRANVKIYGLVRIMEKDYHILLCSGRPKFLKKTTAEIGGYIKRHAESVERRAHGRTSDARAGKKILAAADTILAAS